MVSHVNIGKMFPGISRINYDDIFPIDYAH
jgi:hypothetical protein